MKVIVPTQITDTSLIDSSAGALIGTSVADNSYPTWVSGAQYQKGQRYLYDGNIYESRRRFDRRTATPDTDPQRWTLIGSVTTSPAWVSGAVHAVGDRVYYLVTHRIYQALQATGAGQTTPPDEDPAHWLDIGPMNPWAMFDQSAGSRTSADSPLTFTLQPGIISAVGVLGLVGATSVLIEMYDGLDLVYSHTEDVGDTQILNDWYDYFFAAIIPKTDFVLADVPPYGNATVEFTVTGADAVGVGNLIVGNLIEIGPINFGVSVGIIDYSRKETDDFGITSLVERTYARKIDANIMIDNMLFDYVNTRLAALRATPALYFEPDSYQSLILYGFIRDFGSVIQYPMHSLVSLELEGLA